MSFSLSSPPRLGRTKPRFRMTEWDKTYPLPDQVYEAHFHTLERACTTSTTTTTTADTDARVQTTITPDATHVEIETCIETTLEKASHMTRTAFSEHDTWLKSTRQQIYQLLERVKEIRERLKQLKQLERDLHANTDNTITTIERLLERQNHLHMIADAIAEQLDYFDRLAHLSKLVDPTNIADLMSSLDTIKNINDEKEAIRLICLRTDFLPTLEAMEESIAFLTARPRYQESQIYLEKFKECRIKAAQLIQRYTISAWSDLAQQVAHTLEEKSIQERQNETVWLPLLYVKFRAIAPELSPLIAMLEQLALQDQRCAEMLNECRNHYLEIRQHLLGPLTEEYFNQMDPKQNTLITMTLECLTYINNICNEERHLYAIFFTQTDPKLDTFTGKLVQPIYQLLRTPILQETDSQILEKLYAIIRAHLPADYDDQASNQAQNWEQATEDTRPLLALLHVLQQKLLDPTYVPSDACLVM